MLRCLPGLGKWVGTRLGRSILQKQVLPAAPTPRGSRRSTMAAAERGGHGPRRPTLPAPQETLDPRTFKCKSSILKYCSMFQLCKDFKQYVCELATVWRSLLITLLIRKFLVSGPFARCLPVSSLLMLGRLAGQELLTVRPGGGSP